VSVNGARKTVESYVGYPKDPVSRKMLKADKIYGKAALDNRLALNLYRPLEHGVIKFHGGTGDKAEQEQKNLKAAQDLLQHLVDLAHPGRGDVLYGVVGVPSRASNTNKTAMLEAARNVLDSVMVVSEPFTVAYGMERMSDILVVDIGAGTTDLCRMHGTMPEESDQITNTFAGDFVDNKLVELIKKKHPEAQFSIQMIKTFKERFGNISDTMPAVTIELPVNGKPTSFDITDELLTHNAGRWRLRASAFGGASCERTTDEADLACDVKELGAAYLGDQVLGGLAAAGRIRELRPGAVARVSAAFGWHRAPSAIEVF